MFASNKEAAKSAKEIREIRKEDAHRADEISEHMAHTIRSTLETATQLAEHSVDRFGRAFGFSERDGGETVQQSLRDIQAVTERATVLVHGVQDISREWSDWPQHRFERHLDGFNCKSQDLM